MFYLVAYDIRDPRRLRRIAKIMKDFGTRVQYSVFECDLDSDKTLREMFEEIQKKMDTEKDSVRIYNIDKSLKTIKIIGQGRLTGFSDVIII